jgi:hypothetical protein
MAVHGKNGRNNYSAGIYHINRLDIHQRNAYSAGRNRQEIQQRNSYSAGNYELLDEESSGEMGFHRKLSVQDADSY